jgi:NosR/NirI family transcriptional regulator, nitrous oxide reductase regulator
MASRFRSPIVSARYVINTFVIVALFAIPTFHLIKFDLLGGKFYLFGSEEKWLTVLTAFISLWAGTYVLILILDYLFGRLFCGWICSWGTLLRTLRYLDDKVKRKKITPISIPIVTLSAAILSTIGLLNWFFDIGILFKPQEAAFLTFLIGFVSIVAVGHVMLQKVGLTFCQEYCPIGWYLGTLSQKNMLHIDFQPVNCTVGDVCVTDCPMALDPRLLVTNTDHATFSQCILCADCITACNKCAAKVPGTKPLTLQFGAPSTDIQGVVQGLEDRRQHKQRKRSAPRPPQPQKNELVQIELDVLS